MRPLKLTMTAFGPYKNTEVIDFTKLNQQNLFVISGKTGAGKTTIFDAICYALYGTASGSDRDNITLLRSHFASDDVFTKIELEFILREEVYRISRQVGHIKKGNKTKSPDKYEFFKQGADGRETPMVERQIISEINQRLEQLIGLTADQFKQIVMLPQGEFRKLLTSDTENKEEILRRLFKTNRYQKINTLLKDKRDAVQVAYENKNQEVEFFINHLGTLFSKEESSSVYELFQQKQYNYEQLFIALEKDLTEARHLVKKQEQVYKSSIEKFEEKQKELIHARSINEQFENLDKLKTTLQELTAQKDEFAKKRETIYHGEQASKLIPYELQLKVRNEEVVSSSKKQNDAIKQLEEAESAFTEAEKLLKAEEKKQTDRDQLQNKLRNFQEFLPIVNEISTLETNVTKMKQTLNKNEAKILEIQNEIKSQREQLNKLKIQIRAREKRLETLAEKQISIDNIRKQYELSRNYLKLTDELDKSKDKLKEAQRTLSVKQEQYDQLLANWYTNQAALLAHQLHDGDTCPVCGSLEHPNKAESSHHELNEAGLEAAKKRLDLQLSHYHHINAETKTLETQVTNLVIELKENNLEVKQMQEQEQQLLASGKALKAEIVALEKDSEMLKQDKQLLINLEIRTDKLALELEDLQAKYLVNQTEFSRQEATYIERRNRVPEQFRNLENLQKSIVQTNEQYNELEKRYLTAQERFKQINDEKLSLIQTVKHCKEQLKIATESCRNAQQTFNEQLKTSDFSSVEDYQAKKVAETELTALKNEVAAYDLQVNTITKQKETLQDQLKNNRPIDLQNIKAELASLKENYMNAYDKLTATRRMINDIEATFKQIKQSLTKVTALEKELTMITNLYDVVRGNNEKKLSFERYLQIDYLEQITHAANIRFKSLSEGQYYLVRSERQEAHGRQSGLSLDVYDAYTGLTRDVKTLSGGEKFIASLCLALGMSDVIQSFQGNISIEMMFIDEGFGSLDEESLQKSIDALIELQKTGRMIGVISHVQELKNIFPAILDVRKTNEGTTATRFIIK